MNMIVQGREIAESIRRELMQHPHLEEYTLHIFIVGDNEVIEKYVTKKRTFAAMLGCGFIEHRFTLETTTDMLLAAITTTPTEKTGIVVQLPLPEHIDTDAVLSAIPTALDVDALTEDTPFISPVALAVQEILERHHVILTDANVVVVGNGRLVGAPVAVYMRKAGGNVTIVDESTPTELRNSLLHAADIIVSGAGVPNIIRKDMLKDKVVLIDAGTSTHAGAVVGDIAHDCAEKASLFARTPGGVGPLTVATLFKNLIYGTMPDTTLG